MRRSRWRRSTARRTLPGWTWLSCLAVDPFARREFLEAAGARREAKRLFRADPEEAARRERIVEQVDGMPLQLPVEIDEHVAAGDQLDLGEDVVRREAVVAEHHLR